MTIVQTHTPLTQQNAVPSAGDGFGPAPPSDRQVAGAERRFLIYSIDWNSYRKISDALNGRHFHMSYDGENLELMTTSSIHGTYSRFLCQLVVILTEELGLPRRSCGDMTCDRQDLERAIEPDECFYITNEPLVRGKKIIDLDTDPPPDLGIEVDISRSSLRRLRIYAALKVPEVWRFDAERVIIYELTTGGELQPATHSRYFSFLSGSDLTQFLGRLPETEENELLRQFRAWVREHSKA